jgi:hypothetical protein
MEGQALGEDDGLIDLGVIHDEGEAFLVLKITIADRVSGQFELDLKSAERLGRDILEALVRDRKRPRGSLRAVPTDDDDRHGQGMTRRPSR